MINYSSAINFFNWLIEQNLLNGFAFDKIFVFGIRKICGTSYNTFIDRNIITDISYLLFQFFIFDF